MSIYSVETRNKIYKMVFSNLYKQDYLCINLASACITEGLIKKRRNIDMNNFPEILKFKPKNRNISHSWFTMGKVGYEKRLEILRQAIKETK